MHAVKAFMTNCPLTTSPGTKWYTIEMFVKNNEDNGDGMKVEDGQQIKQDGGKLKARFKSKDVYQCSNDTVRKEKSTVYILSMTAITIVVLVWLYQSTSLKWIQFVYHMNTMHG